MPNSLYYGDNLQVLRDHIPDESMDLVYLDPPFNFNASYDQLPPRQPSYQPASRVRFTEGEQRELGELAG